jgi:hypothetical protein
MRRNSPRWFPLLALLAIQPAHAIIVRNGYDTFGTPENTRHLTLANQDRFDTVGNIQLYAAAPVPGAGQFDFENQCTGTLITPSIILTAAHCFSDGVGNVKSFQSSFGLSAMPLIQGQQVFFAGGGNLSTDDRYSSKNIDYAVQIDRLSIYPGFDLSAGRSITYGGDLALLRVYGAPWLGTLPTNYIPINTSTEEATLPNDAYLDTDFAITIGYGSQGDGIAGVTSDNIAVEKRAGLTEVDFDLQHPDTLVARFLSPSQFIPLLWPSNFLEAAPAPGDSGGPLIRNYNNGAGDVIIGVVQGGGDVYGESNWWTRVSSFASWITSEAAVLGSAPVAAVPGASATNALLPVSTTILDPLTTLKSFNFFGGALNTIFLDPEMSDMIDLNVLEGSPIKSLVMPDNLIDPVSILVFDSALGDFVDSGLHAGAGEQVDFVELVNRIKLVGIHATGTELALGFRLSEDGPVRLDWTATAPVPLPGAAWLVAPAIAMLAPWLRRRCR